MHKPIPGRVAALLPSQASGVPHSRSRRNAAIHSGVGSTGLFHHMRSHIPRPAERPAADVALWISRQALDLELERSPFLWNGSHI
jgi:hypothetical protein